MKDFSEQKNGKNSWILEVQAPIRRKNFLRTLGI